MAKACLDLFMMLRCADILPVFVCCPLDPSNQLQGGVAIINFWTTRFRLSRPRNRHSRKQVHHEPWLARYPYTLLSYWSENRIPFRGSRSCALHSTEYPGISFWIWDVCLHIRYSCHTLSKRYACKSVDSRAAPSLFVVLA